jgi:hypothetical protein
MTANKTYAAILGGAATTILVWGLNTYAHAQIPDIVGGSISTIFTALLVFFVPNTAKVSN